MRRVLVTLGCCVLVAVAPAAARPEVPAPSKQQAIAAVRSALRVQADPCGFRVARISARRTGAAWRVDALLTGRTRGTARWRVGAARRATPANALARRIAVGCPQPPAPPPPPPPPAPGAPAAYTFGPELGADQQALVRRGLDAGARYYRAELGRELPYVTVWAYGDLESLVRAYAASRPASLEESRRLWEAGQVGHAATRKVWLGPRWFASPAPYALKIAAHEAFHLLQFELVGERALSASSLDEIPRAGPWWLAEGAAESFAFRAVAADGALRIDDVRAQWLRSAKATAATLRALSTLRGQRETPAAYDVYALATELLLRDRDPRLVFAYYEAIARGVAWPDAFTSTFGRSFDAFVGEFEAYRRTSR